MGSCLNSERNCVTLIVFNEKGYSDGFTQMFLQSILIEVTIKKITTKQNHLSGSYVTSIKCVKIFVINTQHIGLF